MVWKLILSFVLGCMGECFLNTSGWLNDVVVVIITNLYNNKLQRVLIMVFDYWFDEKSRSKWVLILRNYNLAFSVGYF